MNMELDQEITLLERVRAGDDSAFLTLIDTHYDRIFNTAFQWLGNHADAEDLAQDVCIKIAKSVAKFRGDSRISTWITRIVINAAKDQLRKRRPTAPIDEHMDLEHTAPTARDQLEAQELWRLVRALPDKQRDAMLLVYAQDLSHSEAAQVMNCKESTVSWYIHEAKKQLKGVMSHDA